MWAPHMLQNPIRAGRDDLYAQFAALVESRPTTELHDLLELIPAGEPVPIDEVESATSIVQRFSTVAMSHGALSAEAHETFAEVMNLVGWRSNCGEGGGGPSRFRTRGQPDGSKSSCIK